MTDFAAAHSVIGHRCLDSLCLQSWMLDSKGAGVGADPQKGNVEAEKRSDTRLLRASLKLLCPEGEKNEWPKQVEWTLGLHDGIWGDFESRLLKIYIIKS